MLRGFGYPNLHESVRIWAGSFLGQRNFRTFEVPAVALGQTRIDRHLTNITAYPCSQQ